MRISPISVRRKRLRTAFPKLPVPPDMRRVLSLKMDILIINWLHTDLCNEESPCIVGDCVLRDLLFGRGFSDRPLRLQDESQISSDVADILG